MAGWDVILCLSRHSDRQKITKIKHFLVFDGCSAIVLHSTIKHKYNCATDEKKERRFGEGERLWEKGDMVPSFGESLSWEGVKN
jgi:hypothetical protein